MFSSIWLNDILFVYELSDIVLRDWFQGVQQHAPRIKKIPSDMSQQTQHQQDESRERKKVIEPKRYY
jgi:hypothetical protein